MKPLFRSLFSVAILTAVIATQSHASTELFKGVVLVPPAKEVQAPAGDQAIKFTRGKVVDFATTKPAGTIVILTGQHALYLVIGNGRAVKYKIATAKPGFEWRGSHKVSAKSEWPDWRPPEVMRKRRPELPAYMAGGPGNPLGARAIYLGSSIYRIHGTNEPESIGRSASSGCIRMLNADVMELYANTRLGALVVVM